MGNCFYTDRECCFDICERKLCSACQSRNVDKVGDLFCSKCYFLMDEPYEYKIHYDDNVFK